MPPLDISYNPSSGFWGYVDHDFFVILRWTIMNKWLPQNSYQMYLGKRRWEAGGGTFLLITFDS